MAETITWIETLLIGIPIPILEVWGRFSYFIGIFLSIFAFSGFTFRNGIKWRLSRESQSWDAKSVYSFLITFLLIFLTGYIGSTIVLVPGAQTFESLKDLSVFLCINLFGYPALIAVPFAYGLSDLIEGVPPEFLYDWIFGYFINPTFFWISYQFFGKCPDFRKIKVWLYYFVFVLLFLLFEPLLWGYLCSKQFGADISYYSISSALLFTTGLTWILAPIAMLAFFPLVKKINFFWAEIPDHVREKSITGQNKIWFSGQSQDAISSSEKNSNHSGIAIRIFFISPIIVLVLVLVGSTAYVTLKNAEQSAYKLAEDLHRQWSNNIRLSFDNYLQSANNKSADSIRSELQTILQSGNSDENGKVFILEDTFMPFLETETRSLLYVTFKSEIAKLPNKKTNKQIQLKFPVVTKSPLSREVWYAVVTTYENKAIKQKLKIVTLLPAAFYLGGVRSGNSDSATVFAYALILSLFVAVGLARFVLSPILSVSSAANALAKGDLNKRVEGSILEELTVLSNAFNQMASELQENFHQTKVNEKLILDLNANLEKRIEERTEQLSKTIDHKEQILADLHSAQEQLLINEKLATLGQLAAGMTHELNTPLGAISSSARAITQIFEKDISKFSQFFKNLSEENRIIFDSLLAESIKNAHEFNGIVNRSLKKEWVQRLIQAGIEDPENRVADITSLGITNLGDALIPILKIDGIDEILNQVASFSNIYRMSHVIQLATGKASHVVDALKHYLRKDVDPAYDSLSGVIISEELDSILTLYHSKIKYDVEIIKEYNTTLPCLANRDKLNQVWINLLNNALQSMNYKGRIRLIVDRYENHIVTSVIDNGPGIPDEIKTKIFKPFFTTKKHGEGIGLGLDICKKIVENMNGKIEFKSEGGETTFQVFLPIDVKALG
jgi:signal transduction histidine kinase